MILPMKNVRQFSDGTASHDRFASLQDQQGACLAVDDAGRFCEAHPNDVSSESIDASCPGKLEKPHWPTRGNPHWPWQMGSHELEMASFMGKSICIIVHVGKTIIKHPPVITIFIGAMRTIPSHGWFMALSYPHCE